MAYVPWTNRSLRMIRAMTNPAPRPLIVTGADAAYFAPVQALLASVRRTAGEAFDLVVLDAGLSDGQKVALKQDFGAEVILPDFAQGSALGAGDAVERMLNARPFLDRRFADASVIIWLDADCWVQEAGALDLLVQAAGRGALAVVSESSRYAEVCAEVRWAPFGLARFVAPFYLGLKKAGLPRDVLRAVGDKPVMNAGVFALAPGAPHWDLWRARLYQVLAKRAPPRASALALSLMVHADHPPLELLPETCNYQGPHWRLSKDGARFVERYIPHAPVGIMHLSGLVGDGLVEVETLSGGKKGVALRGG